MGEILDDVEYMAAGDPPPSTGNWTSAQIVQQMIRRTPKGAANHFETGWCVLS